MAEIKTEIFNVKNIDCASCAAKIENGLKSLDGINDAVLDFANLTLHVKAIDQETVPLVLQVLEHGARILTHQNGVRGIVVDAKLIAYPVLLADPM